MHAGQLDRVILVGGSTRTPLVEEKLIQRLNHQPSTEIDPDLCVALGAAVQGALLAGQDVEKVLVDITPHTLGIRCFGENDNFGHARHFAPMIARGTALPCKRSHLFYTCMDGQSAVDIEVFQGESETVTNNRFVGEARLEGLDRNAPAQSPISVTFTLNLNGMLEVHAVDRVTGKDTVATINRSEDGDFAQLTTDEKEYTQNEIAGWLGRPSVSESEWSDGHESDALDGDNPLTERLKMLTSSIDKARATASQQDAVELENLVVVLKEATKAGDSNAFDRAAETIEDLLFYLNDA